MDLDTYTETFLFLCYKAGLTKEDLEDMSFGMCFDFIDEWIDYNTPEDRKVKVASQKEFDSF